MYREIVNKLVRWKENSGKNIVLISGSKKVGKTWAARDFADGFYENRVEIDFAGNDYITGVFDKNDAPDREMIERTFRISCTGEFLPGKTLIILENVHMLNNISNISMFLQEYFGQYDIVMTTNIEPNRLLSENVRKSVEVLYMHPLNFYEFLIVNREAGLCGEIENYRDRPLSEESLKKLSEYLRLYYYIGGMPSVVEYWLEERDISGIDEAKKEIYDSYVEDFAAAGSATLEDKIKKVYDSIGAQLLKENKKFQYGVVKLTARAREYGEGLNALLEGGYLRRVNRAEDGISPLGEHSDDRSFEIFMIDVGMLSYMYSLDFGRISDMFDKKEESAYMEALTEQFVFQELFYNGNIGTLYYWISEATAKINFLFEDSGAVIPVDINIGNNQKAQNVKVYASKYNPPMVLSITEDILETEGTVMKLPLFSVWNI